MRTLRWIAVATVVLTCSLAFANAVTIHNTGVGALGSVDPNYTLTGGTAYIGTYGSPPWVAAPAGSQWLSPNYPVANAPSGNYDYNTTFDFTGLDPATAVMSFGLASDNSVQVLLNGNLILGNCCAFTSIYNASFAAGGAWSSYLVNGTNTLTFTVTNFVQATGNPTGLLVTNARASADPAPEPASLTLFGSGLIGLAAAVRRRMRR